MNLAAASYPQKAIITVIVFSVLRMVLSAFIGLGTDESYYWTYADHLQWNYFDHPPMIAVWTKFFTANLLLEDHTFFLRLGSFTGCAIASFFIYRAIAVFSTPKVAFAAVFLYNTSFYAGITAGVLLMPDAPQMVFWTGAMYSAVTILEDDSGWWPWVMFGLASGLCIMSKVHGVFLWSGFILYALTYRRTWLANPRFYLAILITAVIISPILIWNIRNDFITYRFHSNRVTLSHESVWNWRGLLTELIGEVVINNPFHLSLLVIFFLVKHRFCESVKYTRLFVATALPLLLIIFFIALFRKALPHWSGPAYVTLVPIAAMLLTNFSRQTFRSVMISIGIYSLLYFGAVIFAINYYPGTFGSKLTVSLGKGDISLDNYGWKEAGERFKVFYDSAHSGVPDSAKPPLLCNDWWGSHEEYFFGRPAGLKMIGIGPVNEIHQYAWRNKFNLPGTAMDTGYVIEHSDERMDIQLLFSKDYADTEQVLTIPITRRGKPAHTFYIYRLTGLRTDSRFNTFGNTSPGSIKVK